MTLSRQERKEVSDLFLKKAKESRLAAEDCLAEGYFRAACNRAYYWVLQIVHAGAYLELDRRPQKRGNEERLVFGHDELGGLFNQMSRQCGKYWDNKRLASELHLLRTARNAADYTFEQGLGKQEAEQMLAIAKRVEEVMIKMVGLDL